MLKMPFGRLRKPRQSFGLDVGTSAVKVVQLREVAGAWTLTALGSVALPPDVIADGMIKDPAAVADAIKEAVAKAGVTSREAAIAVAGRELITKKVQLPEVPANELRDAVQLEAAGAGLLVLEAIPAKLGEQVTQRLHIPTIGIGAGPGCSGQVLVLHDMLDVFPGKKARFVRNFMKGASGIADAAERYVRAVRDGSFPAEEHSF